MREEPFLWMAAEPVREMLCGVFAALSATAMAAFCTPVAAREGYADAEVPFGATGFAQLLAGKVRLVCPGDCDRLDR